MSANGICGTCRWWLPNHDPSEVVEQEKIYGWPIEFSYFGCMNDSVSALLDDGNLCCKAEFGCKFHVPVGSPLSANTLREGNQ